MEGELSERQRRLLLFAILLPIALGAAFTAAMTAIGTLQFLFRSGGLVGVPDAQDVLATALIVVGASYIPMIWMLVKFWKDYR